MKFFKPSVSAAGFIGLVLGSAVCCPALSSAQELSSSAVQAKLDPLLLQRLEELEIRGRAGENLNVLVRTASDINPDQEAMLLKTGMIIKSKLGNIATAVVPAGSVRDIAALEFVLHVELAKKLKKREDQK